MKIRWKAFASIPVFLILGFSFGVWSEDRTPAARKTYKAPKTSTKSRGAIQAKPKPEKKAPPRVDVALNKALEVAKAGNYQEAALMFYNMSRNREYEARFMQIKYLLGLMLYELKLYQSAAFQFVDVVRDGNSKYVKKSLEKLSLAADILNNDTLLNYALTKIELSEFPKSYHDMLYFRIGEIQRKKGALQEAIGSFSKVQPTSNLYSKAKYLEGLSYLQLNDLKSASAKFQSVVNERADKSATDNSRTAAQLALARVFYQQKNWDSAIEYYKQIPRDTEFWHDTVFELSWAHLRAAQFRSVLSQLHSLHSPYYEDVYIPESVLLRSIVYLFICQYDEMEKTLDYFEKAYKPIQNSLQQILQSGIDARTYYTEIARVVDNFSDLRRNRSKRGQNKIPFTVARTIMKEGDFKRTYSHIQKLLEEKRRLGQLSSNWRRSGIGQYSEKAIASRLEAARTLGGRQVQQHLTRMSKELDQLFEQHGFARYEMLKGRKENLKKQIAGKGIVAANIDDENERDFYIQNGFEYWPFDGEYWLDEIGNYHYVGVQTCE